MNWGNAIPITPVAAHFTCGMRCCRRRFLISSDRAYTISSLSASSITDIIYNGGRIGRSPARTAPREQVRPLRMFLLFGLALGAVRASTFVENGRRFLLLTRNVSNSEIAVLWVPVVAAEIGRSPVSTFRGYCPLAQVALVECQMTFKRRHGELQVIGLLKFGRLLSGLS